MKSAESFTLMVRVDTRNGLRNLIYNQSNRDALMSANGRNIHHGLGSGSVDGQWQVHQRNLGDDVANGEPGNRIVSVEGIRIRGTLSIESINFRVGDDQVPGENDNSDPSVYSQADQDSLAAWRVYDNTPEGASIQLVDDPVSGEPAIRFSGSGARNGYLLGSLNSRPPAWNNRDQRIVQWRMRLVPSYTMNWMRNPAMTIGRAGHAIWMLIWLKLSRTTRSWQFRVFWCDGR